MLGLLVADFPAWNLAAVLETDTDDVEQLVDAARGITCLEHAGSSGRIPA